MGLGPLPVPSYFNLRQGGQTVRRSMSVRRYLQAVRTSKEEMECGDFHIGLRPFLVAIMLPTIPAIVSRITYLNNGILYFLMIIWFVFSVSHLRQ